MSDETFLTKPATVGIQGKVVTITCDDHKTAIHYFSKITHLRGEAMKGDLG